MGRSESGAGRFRALARSDESGNSGVSGEMGDLTSGSMMAVDTLMCLCVVKHSSFGLARISVGSSVGVGGKSKQN